jgi:hypothetical protein
MKIPFLSKTSVKLIETFKKSEAKSEKQLIEEIHEDFMTEVDKLLAEAKITREVKTDKGNLLNKSEQLKKLGFFSAKDVKDADEEENRLAALRIENTRKESLVKTIDYFTNKYPLYKFITEASVIRICEKYGLIYGPVSKFIAEVPQKNLEEIAKFKIQSEDMCYIEECHWRSGGHPDIRIVDLRKYNDRYSNTENFRYNYYPMPLEIAAPKSNFDTSGMELKGFKLTQVIKREIPDPIVLQPVMHNGNKHYLIITAWGAEASDSEVVNR